MYGRFGGSLLGLNRETSKDYALKRIKIGNLDQKDKENTLNEVRLLASIDNPYVICMKLLTSFQRSIL